MLNDYVKNREKKKQTNYHNNKMTVVRDYVELITTNTVFGVEAFSHNKYFFFQFSFIKRSYDRRNFACNILILFRYNM